MQIENNSIGLHRERGLAKDWCKRGGKFVVIEVERRARTSTSKLARNSRRGPVDLFFRHGRARLYLAAREQRQR